MATQRKEYMIPTAVNLVNMVSQNITDNLRRGQDSEIVLPSLYRLAFMVHYNPAELVIIRNDDTTEG